MGLHLVFGRNWTIAKPVIDGQHAVIRDEAGGVKDLNAVIPGPKNALVLQRARYTPALMTLEYRGVVAFRRVY